MSDHGSAERVRGVLVAHGDMARGLVDAVRKISGADEDVLVPLSNEGRTPERLRQELHAVVGDGPAVVFTDLQAGGCALAALATARDARRAVVCGVNLPMLLDFVFHTELPLEELVTRLVQKGQAGIRTLGVPGSGASTAPPTEAGR